MSVNQKWQKEVRVVNKAKTLFALHLMLTIYSISGICSKLAGRYSFLSIEFCFFYGIIILLLGFYAIGWQQIIKRLPLSVAFANKAVTVIWGSIWGILLFREAMTIGKMIGMAMVIVGVVLYAHSDSETSNG